MPPDEVREALARVEEAIKALQSCHEDGSARLVERLDALADQLREFAEQVEEAVYRLTTEGRDDYNNFND